MADRGQTGPEGPSYITRNSNFSRIIIIFNLKFLSLGQKQWNIVKVFLHVVMIFILFEKFIEKQYLKKSMINDKVIIFILWFARRNFYQKKKLRYKIFRNDFNNNNTWNKISHCHDQSHLSLWSIWNQASSIVRSKTDRFSRPVSLKRNQAARSSITREP